jgi:hypothetical protein
VLATEENEDQPLGPAGLNAHRSGAVVQVNGAAADQAVAAFASERQSNVIALKSAPAISGTLLSRWNLLGRAARDAHLSRSDLAVLHAIADRIGDTGTAWPSVRRIADDARVDPRTVTRSINRLCDCGYLLRQSGSFTTANVYRLGMGEPARSGESTHTGERVPIGKVARRGEAVARYGRTRPEGMGEAAHVILPLNPLNESTQDSSTSAPLTTGTNAAVAREKPSAADKATVRAARVAQVTRDAIEAFNASSLTKAHGGLVPNVDPDVGANKRRAQVKRCLDVARAICRKNYESELIVREFWVDYWDVCLEDDHKSGRIGGGKGHESWVPSFEYLTRETTMLHLYDRVASAAAAGVR